MGVVAHLPQQLEIVLVAQVVLAGVAAAVAVLDLAGQLLPLPPVVVLVAALHLVGSAGRAPEKVVAEAMGEIAGQRVRQALTSDHEMTRRASSAACAAWPSLAAAATSMPSARSSARPAATRPAAALRR